MTEKEKIIWKNKIGRKILEPPSMNNPHSFEFIYSENI